LALLLFTLSLAKRLEGTGIAVNAADPGVVSTPIISMHMWFDPLTDIFFRPFIRTPRQGADTAIRLLLDAENEGKTGTFNLSGHTKQLSKKYLPHCKSDELWRETEERLKQWLH
jgi:NAD(P)-dependent dehydrogenase (short-subunit alcohol dehydrogenase family)